MEDIKLNNKILYDLLYNLIKKWNKKVKAKNVCNLKIFINHVLSNIKPNNNVLCLTIYYLVKIRILIQRMLINNFKLHNFLLCGRRMFIISLILSTKYLLDGYNKNILWSKITRLNVKDINLYEKETLKLIKYDLYISDIHFIYWKNTIYKITT